MFIQEGKVPLNTAKSAFGIPWVRRGASRSVSGCLWPKNRVSLEEARLDKEGPIDPELGELNGERNLKYSWLRPPAPDLHHSDTTEANPNVNTSGSALSLNPWRWMTRGHWRPPAFIGKWWFLEDRCVQMLEPLWVNEWRSMRVDH